MTTTEPASPDAPQSADELATPKRARGRRIGTWILVVLTSLAIVLAAVGVWAHNTLLDTDKFMETIDPALESPDLYQAVGERVSAQALEALDLETRIATALAQLDEFVFGALVEALEIGEQGQAILESVDRPSLEALAPTLSSGLEERITTRIEGFINSEAFRSAVPELARRGHEGTVALLRGDLAEIPNISIEGGEVQLNLIPIITEAIRRVLPDLSGLGDQVNLPDQVSNRVEEAREQLATALGANLPDDFGELTLMSEDQLTQAQDAVVLLDRAMWALVILAVLLGVATIFVSQTRQRTAIHLAVGVVVGLIVVLLLLGWVQDQVVQAIVDPNDAATARQIIADVLSGLRQGALIIVLAALGVAVFLWAVTRSEKEPEDSEEIVSV